jgi:hypothetical protein
MGRDERGIAMITAVLISSIVLLLGVAAAGVAVHNDSQSALDRKRLQSVDAAEAGINAANLKLQTTSTGSLPCTLSGDLGAGPPVHYEVTIAYYATYPPTGAALACPPPQAPLAATYSSVGTATAGTQAPRKMVSQVRLTPDYGAFANTLFADTQLDVKNSLTIDGNNGNDGDIYTNGDITCPNTMAVAGTLYAQGQVTLSNSCNVAQDVYANGQIVMSSSATVGHDAISATGAIQMSSSARIGNNATAATTIQLLNSASVGGTRTENHPSPAPPHQDLPTVDYDQTAWTAVGYTIRNFSACGSGDPAAAGTAKRFIDSLSNDNTNYVVRITPACSLVWQNNSTVTVYQDLAIVYDGLVGFENHTEWVSGDGKPHTLYFITPSDASTPCSGTTFSTTNNTNFDNNLKLLVCTPCTASFANNNLGLGGQILAGKLTIQNSFELSFTPIQVPGAGPVSGYKEDIAYLREEAA